MDLAQAAATLGATLTAPVSVASVDTDTRAMGAGGLFVALRGDRFDGHDFIADAVAAGAAAVMVDRRFADTGADAGVPMLIVDDTRFGLGALAAWWRNHFDIPLIGITGSNGKTTVKEMCAEILAAQMRREGLDPAAAVLATAGNFNNDIGLPLTLLRLRAGHRAAIIEMGMNHPGEIAYLTAISRPTVALVTNALRAHLEGLGGLDAVAVEKGTIYQGLGEHGVAVVNADSPFADYWRGINPGRRIVGFGLSAPEAEVRAVPESHGLAVRLHLSTPEGVAQCALRVPGEHNVRNALAAVAACLAAGATLADAVAGLQAYGGTKGRLQRKAGKHGAIVLDDTYNANPDSVRAGIDVLAATPGRKVLVLGDMGELGEASAQLHDEVGGYAKSHGIDHLLTLGSASATAAHNFGEGATHFAEVSALVTALEPLLDESTVVLVKGSRFMRMERVVDAIVADDNNNKEQTHVA
ncbi:UDP-N-acetylmuramoyl-tripeptide--D-alanyl-D-alanine ligase [Nitrogeniibacter mangrovi]|uniref:UDP-N-acetylmuramoyl-tripeptide--D-alanyl-D-alanine ligase n=2 Tax=Nitrogeniibacter mangrovi TaxID=2016596 RepID=A0A6C1B8L2_9RHOO|nr:UDP-N-acetylmuramoyl-tripeptide--D-alanyl-D-alanine ligase [Nitrogeniibacter mangrovi]